MNKHLKGVIAAAMTVTMMAAAAAPAGSMLTAITPVKSITASASLSGEYNFGTIYSYTDSQGNLWKYALNSAKTAACIWNLDGKGTETVTVPNTVPKTPGSSVKVPVRAIDWSVFHRTDNMKHLILPANLRKMDSLVARYCYKLEDVTIQSTLTSVATDTFAYCPMLTKVIYKGVTPNSLEMFNSVDLAQIDTNGSGSFYPLFMMIAGEPCLCPYNNFSNYITANHWKFQNSSWMTNYISAKAQYIANMTSYTADSDSEHIGNICKYIANAANANGTKITNNKRYNGDTSFFFDPSHADSLGCAKAFDLIANRASFDTQANFSTMMLKAGTSLNSPYEYLNVIFYDGFVYTIDSMHGSFMETYKRLKGRLGNYLPNRRFYLTPAELDSTLHTTAYSSNSSTGNEFVAVPYRARGDLNNSNTLNWDDCNTITDYLNGTRQLSLTERFQADFNLDGVINYSDVTAMQGEFNLF